MSEDESVRQCEPRVLAAAEALVSPRSIDERLASAAERLLALEMNEIPRPLRIEFAAVHEALTAAESVGASLELLSDERKWDTAKRIFQMAITVSRLAALEEGKP